MTREEAKARGITVKPLEWDARVNQDWDTNDKWLSYGNYYEITEANGEFLCWLYSSHIATHFSLETAKNWFADMHTDRILEALS